MTDFKDMLACSDYNWIQCSIAQRDVKAVLMEFVKEDIKDLQKQLIHNGLISKSLPSNTICNRCRMQNLLPCRTSKLCKFKNKACSFHKDSSLQPRRCPTNGLCDDIRFGIIDHHRFCGPSWKNTDASKWCTDSWTIAKCYMPPDGYLNANSAEETDFNGVLSVIINCIDCQRRFREDLNSPINVCTKARDNSRVVRHSPTLKISDDERDSIIDSLVDLLNDSMFFRNNQLSAECREKLTKVKSNTMRITTTDITNALEDSVQRANQTLEELKKPNSLDAETETTLSNLINLADNLQSICTSVKAELNKKAEQEKRTRLNRVNRRNPDNLTDEDQTGVMSFARGSQSLGDRITMLVFLSFLVIFLFNNMFIRLLVIVCFPVALCYNIYIFNRSALSFQHTTYTTQTEWELDQIEHTTKVVKTLKQRLKLNVTVNNKTNCET